MDVQLPHLASAGTSSATSTQSTPRPGQGGGRRESAGSGKSFSSELHEVHTAKESRHEIGRSQTEGDEHDAPASSDESTPTATAQTSSGAIRDEQTGDRAVEPSRHDSDTVTASPLPDVTTQSVLLALIAQPIVNTDAQALTQTLSGEQTNTAMESVMPSVMEDGTSLPVTAADSSTFPQVDNKESTAKPTDPTAAIQSGAPLLSAVDTERAADFIVRPRYDSEQSGPADSRRAPQSSTGEIDIPAHAMRNNRKFPRTGEAKNEPVVLPNDLRSQVREDLNAVKALTAEQIQRPEDNRPVVMERPVPAQEIPGPKEEMASRQPSVAPTVVAGTHKPG